MKASEYNISKEKFVFANNKNRLHDNKLETKPISFFKDAFNRFKKNKASIVASFIIILLGLYALLGPIFSPYDISFSDDSYALIPPRNQLFYKLGIPFWDGFEKKENLAEEAFYLDYAIGVETGVNVVRDQEYELTIKTDNGYEEKKFSYYKDMYRKQGVIFKNVTEEEYNAIQRYQDEHEVQIIYPITNKKDRPKAQIDNNNANYWFKTSDIGIVNGKPKNRTTTIFENDEFGKFIPIYRPYYEKENNYFSKMRIEYDGENTEPKWSYALKNQTGYEIRIDYDEYFKYEHEMILKDGIKQPVFIFGTTNSGQDVFTRLAYGARFSFILAIVVSSVNLLVGAIYGAIEGYYGGKIDLVMERFCDILSAVPFMIVISLLKYNMLDSSQVLILFIAFFLTGWIGMAGRTRMQFYRFKNQEYVLAARTLGASDARIMFKHIFPNAIGTLITSCVLIIPGMIFSETSLTYLNIINLDSSTITSVGALLSQAQQRMTTHPYMILFPSLYISLLMLSFNLFGNGLRDAFNPSLRGTED